MFSLEFSARLVSSQARERFEKGKRLAPPQPARESGSEGEFFYLDRSQPFEKARFAKINVSKRKLFY